MNVKRSTRIRALIGGVVLAGAIALSAAPASAATYLTTGVRQGDACIGAKTVVSITGAKACFGALDREQGRFVQFQAYAADVRGDGHSARTEVEVLQRIPNSSFRWERSSLQAVTNSSGKGTTRIGSIVRLNKRADADMFRVRIRACTYESGPGTYVACSGWSIAHEDVWTDVIL